MSIINVLSVNECRRYFMFSEFSWGVEALRRCRCLVSFLTALSQLFPTV